MRIGRPIAFLLAGVIVGGTAIALAQSGADGEKRGSAPPGTSRDGSKPADGAITGGAIEPANPQLETPREEVERCKQLKGALREGCLRDLRQQARPPRAQDQARSHESGRKLTP